MDDPLFRFYPFLEPELREEILEKGKFLSLPGGQPILAKGAYVKQVPLVISGSVKVMRKEENKELLLYYIKPGESCVMSLTACLHNDKSKVEAATETDSEIILIPATLVKIWMERYTTWNAYVYDLFNQRYTELLDTIDQLVFHRMDDRILAYLHAKAIATGSPMLEVTHQEIANHIGTAREVVSRILKRLENTGTVSLGRGTITLSGEV